MEKQLTVSVSKGNDKMGYIPSVSLPAGVTCRKNAPCKKGCYALKGVFLYKNVKNAYANNLAIYKQDPKRFEESILEQIPLIGVFRWHVSGDVVDMDYLKMMVRIAKKLKQVKFLAFTKKYELVNEYLEDNKLPKNLKIVFSGWKGLKMDNPNNLPVAWMYDKNDVDDRIPKSSIPCGGNCAKCMACWNLRKRQSVYFHKH